MTTLPHPIAYRKELEHDLMEAIDAVRQNRLISARRLLDRAQRNLSAILNPSPDEGVIGALSGIYYPKVGANG